MTDWQVGALAVKRRGSCKEMPRGTVARVVGFNFHDTGLGLLFENWPYPGGWYAYNFDKIKPDTEPCEEEFTALLKLSKKQGADA